jgi:hypothetical protein
VHAGVTAKVAAETTTTMATRRLGRLERKKEQGRENKGGCARGDDGDGTCKDLSQPGSMAGITSGVRSGAVANGGSLPPRLEGRGIHMEGENLELTLGATGRSAGIGEAARCELASVEEDDGVVQRKQRKVARGDDPVRLLLPGRLRLGEGRRAPTDGLPRLLLLLSPFLLTSQTMDWGGESPTG